MIRFSAQAVNRAVSRTAEAAYGEAREVCPVRTGRLKNSISLSAEGNRAVIFTDVEYAAAVELGTSRQKPQPFLSEGIRKAAAKAGEIFREELL